MWFVTRHEGISADAATEAWGKGNKGAACGALRNKHRAVDRTRHTSARRGPGTDKTGAFRVSRLLMSVVRVDVGEHGPGPGAMAMAARGIRRLLQSQSGSARRNLVDLARAKEAWVSVSLPDRF